MYCRAWVTAARTIAEIAQREVPHVEAWFARGVRDRRPTVWELSLRALVDSLVLRQLDFRVRKALDGMFDEFVSRYGDAFEAPATLVHQDSGCCNVPIVGYQLGDSQGPVAPSEAAAIVFDWADVIVGHPMFSWDRLLDQTRAACREAVNCAFCEPLSLGRPEFDAMRRSNVMHEVLRYHDELSFLDPFGEPHASLSNSVRSQLKVLVEHEQRRAASAP